MRVRRHLVAVLCACLPVILQAQGTGVRGRGAAGQAAVAVADPTLKTRVESALAAAADLRGRTLTAEAKSGTVTVTGKVTTTSELQTVGAVVRAVPGVKDVRFAVQVEPAPPAGRGAGRGAAAGRGAPPEPVDR